MNVVQVGLGPLGQKLVRHAVERGDLHVVAAVGSGPDKVGRDLGEVCSIGRLGVLVSPDLGSALAGKRAEVALLTTVSSLHKVEPQIVQLARAGLHIVSSCEALSFPWATEPPVAARLDEVCRAHGVACLGTGVNPGFLMDYLPIVLTAVCQQVQRVRVLRVQDASCRRTPFQQKIGAGLSLAQFRAKVEAGTLGHVGLPESIRMIAHRLGWQLSKITERLEPVVADQRVLSGHLPVEPGQARGVHQVGAGFVGDAEVITLDFLAAVGQAESYDRVDITGEPNITSTIAGGVNGDVATCAIILNAIHSIVRASPGLKTMVDIPPVAFSRLVPGEVLRPVG